MATRVLDLIPAESTACAGFPSDTYDRYVLGLLDPAERQNVNRELEHKCPECIAGVQRSINLWLVFAGSLQQVEPSADFRGRLIRIAELSNRVLTVPKRYKHKPAVLISSLVMVCLVLGLLLFFTFLAGQQSARLETQRVKNELANLHSESTASPVRPQEESDREHEMPDKLNHAGASNSLPELQNALARARLENNRYQAAIQSYRDSLERDKQRTNENSTLVAALENPGVRLLTFKTPEATTRNAEGPTTAYAFSIANTKVLFVASKMPIPADDEQYQLWLVRRSDHSFVSLGLLSSKVDVPEVLTYEDDNEVIKDMAGLLVTAEPLNGSATPSATRILETAGVPAPVPPPPAASPLTAINSPAATRSER